MLGSNQNKSYPLLFTPLGLVRIKQCPRCNSTRFGLIDNNTWFHCWECRLVENISKLKGLEIIQ